MAKYEVDLDVTLNVSVEVEARDKDEAYRLAVDKFWKDTTHYVNKHNYVGSVDVSCIDELTEEGDADAQIRQEKYEEGVRTMYECTTKAIGEEPRFAVCKIVTNEGEYLDVTFVMGEKYWELSNEEDNKVFFYVHDLNDLLAYMRPDNGEDFHITNVWRFDNKI